MPRLKCKVSFVSLPKKLLKDYGLHTLDALPFFLSVKMVFNFNCFATNLENQGQTKSCFGRAFELDEITCTPGHGRQNVYVRPNRPYCFFAIFAVKSKQAYQTSKTITMMW